MTCKPLESFPRPATTSARLNIIKYMFYRIILYPYNVLKKLNKSL